MWLTYIFCIVIYICLIELRAAKHLSKKYVAHRRAEKNDCWMTLNAQEHFDTIEALEKKYAKVRREYDQQQLLEAFDDEMLGDLLDKQGAANLEVQKAGNRKSQIPSGINLGGHSMMRMRDSIMFFHRMKLRNDTRFRVNFLTSNFSTMTMISRVSLNDLHLVGNYERTPTQKNPSLLNYSPTYGEIQVLLKDVLYKMEGRYRLLKDQFYLEMVLSELYIPYDGILMLYANQTDADQKVLQSKNVGDFLDRLKTDLDLWIKDYFNEFLSYNLPKPPEQAFLQYDKERVMILNRYVDSALNFLKNRLKELDVATTKLPSFVIYSFNGMVLQLRDGSLSGLDTMYRRSMATNSLEKDVRKVDAVIAFSSLKARYSYEVKLTTGAPPLYGSLILTGDELSAIISISMVKEPLFVDLKFDFIRQLKPEHLTIEGSTGRIISTFKHVLELHILAIMTNTMIDQVKQLSSLTKCVPTLVSHLVGTEGGRWEKLNQLYVGDPGQTGDERGPNDPRLPGDPRPPDESETSEDSDEFHAESDNDSQDMGHKDNRKEVPSYKSKTSPPEASRHRGQSSADLATARTSTRSYDRQPDIDIKMDSADIIKKQDLKSPFDTDFSIY